LDDPDIWANLNITIPSLIYLVYNIQILMHPENYGVNFLYVKGMKLQQLPVLQTHSLLLLKGDILYFAGSVFYLFASLRDDGWFWFLPLAGSYYYYYDEQTEEKLQVSSHESA